MKKIKLALAATIGLLFLACGSKTEVDFSIIPVKGANGEYQYIDMSQNGKIVINPQFSKARYFRDDIALVKTSGENGKWGYIDKKGKYAIAPTYSIAQDFSEGVAWAQIEGQPPMLIDKSGKVILQIDSLTAAYPFKGDMSLASIWSQGQYLNILIDKKGGIIKTMEDEISIVNDGLYAFKDKETEKWGFKNIKGETVINSQFDGAYPFFDGMAVVKTGEKYGAVDKNGSVIINMQYDDLNYDKDGLFAVKVGNKWGWINNKNEFVINPQYGNAMGFSGNKLAPVRIDYKWAYINKKAQVVINPQFEAAMPFSGDYAMVESDDKIGFINKKGDFIVPPLYDEDSDDSEEYETTVWKKGFLFLPCAKLEEKQRAWQEIENERVRKATEAEIKAARETARTAGNIFTDERDGKEYIIVKIGNHTWMAENLNYEASNSKCYGNKPENCDAYGRLYDWNAAKEACPAGWLLPSYAEWNALVVLAGDEETAGKQLKAKLGWNKSWGKSGLDAYGFSAFPGGYGDSDGSFGGVGDDGYWWSAGEDAKSILYTADFILNNSYRNYIGRIRIEKGILFSIRCVQGGEKDKNFAKDIDKVLKNVAGLQTSGKTELGGRRGSATGGFNEGYAEGGSGGIVDMLGGLMGGSAGGIGTKPKGGMGKLSQRDIDMGSGDGSRSKAEIMSVVNDRMPDLRNIYNKYLKLRPGFGGKVTLKFTIAHSGDIISISIVSSTTGYAEFDNAIKNMVATWKWKAIKSGNTTPTIPFNFKE